MTAVDRTMEAGAPGSVTAKRTPHRAVGNPEMKNERLIAEGSAEGATKIPLTSAPTSTALAGSAAPKESSLRWRLASALLLLAVAIGALFLADAASAEDRRLKVVGVQPLDARASRAGGPRQGAINQALYEGVSRVAQDLVVEYGPPVEGESSSSPPSDATRSGGDDAPSLKAALGKDMTPFARSFRIVEDQGSRPVLFPGESEATREYVVVVDVTVDVDRVRERLAARGLIAIEEEVDAGSGLQIEALGLRHWSGFEAFVALLESPSVGATEVRPLEFEAGRALLFAAVNGDPEDVLARILAAAPRDLRISSRSGGAGAAKRSDFDRNEGDSSAIPRLEVVVLWTPPDAGRR